MLKNFFVYGTLVFPEIIFALTKKQFKNQNAILEGYKKFKIFDNDQPRPYPGISKNLGSKVVGKIIFDIDEKSAKILDFFEGFDYDKKILTIKSENNNFNAIVYVWKNKQKDKLKSKWDEKEFKDKYLNFYINKKIPQILSGYNKANIGKIFSKH